MANSAFNHSPTIVVPGSSTDNAVIRWDGTGGKTYLNSGVIIDDSNVITGITSLTVDNLNVNGNTIISTDSNGSITLTPNGSGSVVISKVDINSGDITGVTISGGLTWSAAQNLNSQALTNVNIDSGDISAGTVSGSLTWSAAQTFGAVTATQVDITAAGDLRLQDSTGGQYVALEAAGTTTTHTLTLPAAQGGASTVLTNNGSGALSWAAGGGVDTSGTPASTQVALFTDADTVQGLNSLKFADDGDGSTLTIDGDSSNARLILKTNASSSANFRLQWTEGSGNGSTGNMSYEFGHATGSNKFVWYSRATAGISGSAGTGGNIMEIADGTGQCTFPFGVSGVNSTNSGVNFVGLQNGVSMADNETMSITIADSAFVLVRNITTGRAGLFFAEYGSTMVEISDPGNVFEPSETDNGKINVYKGANNGVMYVMNRSNGTKTISVLILGHVYAATMPS